MSSNSFRVWIVDDDQSMRWVMERALSKQGMLPVSFGNAEACLDDLSRNKPDVLISDVRMPGIDGFELLRRVHEMHADLPVIITTAHSDLESALTAYKGGAHEYLPKPFDVTEFVSVVERAAQQFRANEKANEPDAVQPQTELFGEAPAMQEVFRAIGRLSRTSTTVLITGESGTGKELVARSLHRYSPRAGKPFIAINMAAIPSDLLESELFGHERGAFTGAHMQRKGRFEQADGGTLFMDEIGDMPKALQTRLLRVLDEGEFYRVGGHAPVKVNVRILTATNRQLLNRLKEGEFREDLFHRLNVVHIHLPALRERVQDLPLLARNFLTEAVKELEVEPKMFTDEALRILAIQQWPGNLRELRNLCHRLAVLAPGKEITAAELPAEYRGKAAGPGNWNEAVRNWARKKFHAGEIGIHEKALQDMESALITAALEFSGGHKQEAARMLGIGRNTLARKLKEYELK